MDGDERSNAEKTELVILAGRNKLTSISVKVGDEEIESRPAIKYLGVWLDKDLRIKVHIKNGRKANKIILSLQRLMPNLKGPSSGNWALLCAAANSVILYGAPAWTEALKFKKYRHILRKTQRNCLLRITSAYRTHRIGRNIQSLNARDG